MIYNKPKWVGDKVMEQKVGDFILENYPQLQHYTPVFKNHTPNRWTKEHAMIPHINDCLMIFRKGFVFNIAAWEYFMKNHKEWGDDDGVFFPMKWDGTVSLWNMSDTTKETGKSHYYRFKDVADKVLMSNYDLLSETASKFFDL